MRLNEEAYTSENNKHGDAYSIEVSRSESNEIQLIRIGNDITLYTNEGLKELIEFLTPFASSKWENR